MSKPSFAKQAAPTARAVTGPGNVARPQRQVGSTSAAPQATRAGVKPCSECEAKHGPKFAGCKHKQAQRQAQAPAAKPAKRMVEHGNFKFVARFKEASSDSAGQGKRFRVTMLQEGLGNFGDCFYYTADAIKSAPPVFEGKKFMINHPSESEEEDRPERDVRDISGYFENCAAELSESGQMCLMGDLIVAGQPADPTDPFKRERVLMLESIEYQKKHPDQDLVALSINAGGDFDTMPIDQFMESTPIPPACQAKLLEAVQRGVTQIRPVRAMTTATSCDLVTTAGAGGSINQLLEGGKDKMAKQAKQAKESKEKHEAETHEAEGHQDGEGALGADGKPGDAGDQGDGDGQTGEHPDADQDKALIAKMLAKHLGDGFTDEDHAKGKEAYESAKAMGFDDKHCEAIAAHEVAKMRAGGGMHQGMEAHHGAEGEAHEAEESEGEAHEADAGGYGDGKGLGVGAKTVGGAGSAKGMQKNKESARKDAQGGTDVVKLTARVAFLESELSKVSLEKHMEAKLRESKLPMSASKKFRECVKSVRTIKEFDEKLGIFKEAFGLRGEAPADAGFILGAEKQGGTEDGAAGFDFSDCVAE